MLNKLFREALQDSLLSMTVSTLKLPASERERAPDNVLCGMLIPALLYVWTYPKTESGKQWEKLYQGLVKIYHRPKAIHLIKVRSFAPLFDLTLL